jgi:Ca2+-binding RTX toxin-like protein
VIGGQGDDLVRGSSRSNVLDGGAGDDRLIGADGDTLLGGAGDDILSLTIPSGPKSLPILVDGGDDAGLDRLVLRGGMATFNDDTVRHIDAVDVRGTGVDLADVSQGARITIYSAGGAEVFGTSGDDLIKGGRGSDTIEGGAGADRMFGSGPESREGDIFVFTHLSDMMGGGQTDRILDFGANDRIDLSQIDADPEQQDGIQHFTFVESFSDRGGSDAEVMVRADGGSNFTVLFDSNHDGLADASFRVVGAMPTEQNFILTPAQPEFG